VKKEMNQEKKENEPNERNDDSESEAFKWNKEFEEKLYKHCTFWAKIDKLSYTIDTLYERTEQLWATFFIMFFITPVAMLFMFVLSLPMRSFLLYFAMIPVPAVFAIILFLVARILERKKFNSIDENSKTVTWRGVGWQE
jgi:hypothetical protein